MHRRDTLVGERVCDVEIRIGIEGGRERCRGTVVGTRTTIGADQDVREGIGLPLETDITVPAIVARETLRIGVREGAVGLAVEVLAAILINIIAFSSLLLKLPVTMMRVLSVKLEAIPREA